jgi:hypothetical protein
MGIQEPFPSYHVLTSFSRMRLSAMVALLALMAVVCIPVAAAPTALAQAAQATRGAQQARTNSTHSMSTTNYPCAGGGPGIQTFGTWADNEAVGNNLTPPPEQCPRGIYREAQMYFYVPTIKTTVANAAVGIWAGVGGDNTAVNLKVHTAVLVQAGVLTTVVSGQQVNRMFFQIVSSQSSNSPYSLPVEFMTACQVNAHDHIYVDVQSNLNNNGWDYFHVQDLTTPSSGCVQQCSIDTTGTRGNMGAACPIGIIGRTSYNSDSATGECVIEHVQGGSYPLAEWTGGNNEGTHNLRLYGCSLNQTYVIAQTHAYSNISHNGQNSGCPCLTQVEPLDSSGDFTVTWLTGN